ncbi:hypothetical protein ACOMHN_036950 [Nucella lapillus]
MTQYMKWQGLTQHFSHSPYVFHTCTMPNTGLLAFLVYNFFILVICALQTAFTHRLDNGESNLIFTCTSIILVIWVCFIPAYVVAEAEIYKTLVLVAFLFANHFAVLVCIFVPMIYAVLTERKQLGKGMDWLRTKMVIVLLGVQYLSQDFRLLRQTPHLFWMGVQGNFLFPNIPNNPIFKHGDILIGVLQAMTHRNPNSTTSDKKICSEEVYHSGYAEVGEENETMYDVIAVLGSSTNDESITATRILSMGQVPMISVYATSDELSDSQRFPYFLRVVPPDR